MRYKIDRGKDVFDLNPELRLHEEFAYLRDRQMRYVMYYEDPESPYAAYPDRKRKQRAALAAGYNLKEDVHNIPNPRAADVINGLIPNIEKAIIKFREIVALDRQEEQEMIEMVESQIQNIRTVLKTQTSDVAELEKRNKLVNSLPDLKATLRKLQASAGMEVTVKDAEEEEEDHTLSVIDKVNLEEQQRLA